jgi:hypothetical protein
MDAKTWARLLICGVICGAVWAVLAAVLVGQIGGEFLTTAVRSRPSEVTSADRALMFGLTMAAGLWAMWMYSFVRQSLGPGLKAAAVVGLAWWLIAGLQSMKWMVLEAVPGQPAVSLGLAILPAMIAATFIGAWFYDQQEAKR